MFSFKELVMYNCGSLPLLSILMSIAFLREIQIPPEKEMRFFFFHTPIPSLMKRMILVLLLSQ